MQTPTYIVAATPCYGGSVTLRYYHATFALVMRGLALGIPVSIETISHESLITRARNTLVARFLDNPRATHLLFIDADIGFDPAQVERMLAFNEDVVAGMYPLKTIAWDELAFANVHAGETLDTAPIRFVGKPMEGPAREMRDGFVTASYAGTGFMLIRREALLRMVAAHPELQYSAGHHSAEAQSPNQYALFDGSVCPETRHYLSEDYTFCARWRALGGKIWLDTQSRLTHIGPHEFTATPAGRFRAAA
jgi:hypothetical protein